MAESFLKFCAPELDEATISEVVDCLHSGWLATGPRVQKFEAALSEYFKAPCVAAFNSATSGLHLALKSFGIAPGDEVITTPMTFVSSLNAIVHNGAKPILVDVNLQDRNLDISLLEQAITPRTKAILPVHFAGIPVDLDPLYEIAEKYHLRVLEDCAHAVGSSYKGRILGSFGDTQVFSFHPNKVITSGEGGAVTTRDADLLRRLQVGRFHGIDREAWNRYDKNGSQHYDVIEPGYKYNMMDIQAAIGIHQLKHLREFMQKRAYLVARYHKLLSDMPELTLPTLPAYACEVSWYIYAPLINSKVAEITRDALISRMKEENIGLGYHHHAVHLYTYYQQAYGYKRGDFPNAEAISDRIFSLPLFTTMTEADQDRVVNALKKVFSR